MYACIVLLDLVVRRQTNAGCVVEYVYVIEFHVLSWRTTYCTHVVRVHTCVYMHICISQHASFTYNVYIRFDP